MLNKAMFWKKVPPKGGEKLNDIFPNFTTTNVPSDYINQQSKKEHYCQLALRKIKALVPESNTNKIRTTKYKWYTLIPLSILFQLSRLANFYFLCISLLQLVPAISDTGGVPTFALPVVIVTVIATVKECIEDYKRYESDKEENSQEVHGFENKKLCVKKWGDLKVGDVIKIRKGEQFPADLLLLNCSSKYGICNVETKNFDGETNIKHKHCIPEISELFCDDFTAATTQINVQYEAASSDSHRFAGFTIIQKSHKYAEKKAYEVSAKYQNGTQEANVEKIALNENQFLLRGTTMVTTKWAYGCVLYVGNETRLFKSGRLNSKLKKSRLDLLYGTHVIIIALCQLLYLMIEGGVSFFRNSEYKQQFSFFQADTYFKGETIFFISLGSGVILNAAIIPGDLLILWQVNRWVQAKIIERDKYFSEFPTESAHSRTPDLIEELGNITYVFTDKTGTLTNNSMSLECIGLGEKTTIGMARWTRKKTIDNAEIPEMREFYQKLSRNSRRTEVEPLDGLHPEASQWKYSSISKWDVAHIKHGTEKIKTRFRYLLLAFSLCHTVSVDENSYVEGSEADRDAAEPASSVCSPTKENGIPVVSQRKLSLKDMLARQQQYDASSPDELAFVSSAQQIGIEFSGRPNLWSCQIDIYTDFCNSLVFQGSGVDLITNILPKDELATINGDDVAFSTKIVFPLLSILEFDFVRKRMSIITKDVNGTLLLLCKGSDSTMLKIRDPKEFDDDTIISQLEEFAKGGLRTMLFGYKILNETEYREFKEKYLKIKYSGRTDIESEMISCMESIETGITITGCSGIDDSLQQGVPEVINDLKLAGVKVHVLTGDRIETAENVARSVNLINEKTFVSVIDEADNDKINEQLSTLLQMASVRDSLTNSYLQWWKEIQWDLLGIKDESFKKIIDSFQNKKASSQTSKSAESNISSYSPEAVSLPRSTTIEIIDRNKTVRFLSKKRYSSRSFGYLHGSEHEEKQKLPKRTTIATIFSEFDKAAEQFPLSGRSRKKRDKSLVAIKNSIIELLQQEVKEEILPEEYDNFSVESFENVSIVITGDVFTEICNDYALKVLFYGVLKYASSLIACRLTPAQKAQLVTDHSRFNPRSSSMAIGDGANDVGMILAANAGVGIAGKEGTEASRVADFSIYQFRHIRKLLFVYGRETLRRTSFLIYFCIFRSIYAIGINVTYNFFSVFSNTDLWNIWTKQFLTTLFATIPLMVVVCFGRFLPHEFLISHPVYYNITPSSLWPYTRNDAVEQVKSLCSRCYRSTMASLKRLFCKNAGTSVCWKKFSNFLYRSFYIMAHPENCTCCGFFCLILWAVLAMWCASVQLLLVLFGTTGTLVPSIESRFGLPSVGVGQLFFFLEPLFVFTTTLLPAIFAKTLHLWFILVFACNIILYYVVWITISLIPQLQSVAGNATLTGSFILAHSVISFYLVIALALGISFLPLLLLLGYQFIFNPTKEQIAAKAILNDEKVEYSYRKTPMWVISRAGQSIINRGFCFSTNIKDKASEMISTAIAKIYILGVAGTELSSAASLTRDLKGNSEDVEVELKQMGPNFKEEKI